MLTPLNSDVITKTNEGKMKLKNETKKLIKDYYEQGLPVVEIADMLNKDGHKTVTGSTWGSGNISVVAHKLGCARRVSKSTGYKHKNTVKNDTSKLFSDISELASSNLSEELKTTMIKNLAKQL